MRETKVALDNDNIKLSVPLFKVDTERRIVHGFATVDNLDKQADIVTRDASIKAFERFRGNIREQHDPHKAVGRVVEFKEDRVFDKASGKAYNGVFVSAYVSKGAEDTWQKVLDGTLSGFSIGGAIKDTQEALDEESGSFVRIITDYELLELSLVDNPANQLANVVSIEKIDGSMYINTPLVKGGVENIFWCPKDGIITLKSSESETCVICKQDMQNTGFVESNDSAKDEFVKNTVAEYSKNFMSNKTAKEAKNMAEDAIEEIAKSESEEAEVSEVPSEVPADEEVIKSDEVTETEASDESELVEKTESVDEDSDEIEKSDEVEQTEAAVETESVEKADSEVADALVSSLSKMADAVAALNTKIDDLAKTVQGVKSEVDEVKSNTEEFGKRVDAVEDTTAFRKSGDLGEVVQEEPVRKNASLWGGRFLTTADL